MLGLLFAFAVSLATTAYGHDFCVVENSNQKIHMLIECGVLSWNNVVPPEMAASFSGTCGSGLLYGRNGVNTISLEPIEERPAHPSASTTYFDKEGNVEVDIRIDATRVRRFSVFYNLLLHEMGHVFGLRDDDNQNSIMGYNFRRLQSTPGFMSIPVDDIVQLHSMYDYPLILYPSITPPFSIDENVIAERVTRTVRHRFWKSLPQQALPQPASPQPFSPQPALPQPATPQQQVQSQAVQVGTIYRRATPSDHTEEEDIPETATHLRDFFGRVSSSSP